MNISLSSSPSPVSLQVADISLFCKHLRQYLAAAKTSEPPGHLMLLNLVAKSAGFRNYQALRANATAAHPNVPPALPLQAPRDADLPKAVARALTHFDTHGRMMRLPLQLSVRHIAMHGVWCRLPGKRDLTEAEVNGYIAESHTFQDNATLRREMVNMKLLWRTKDGRTYRKQAIDTTTDAQQFMKLLLKLTAKRIRSAKT